MNHKAGSRFSSHLPSSIHLFGSCLIPIFFRSLSPHGLVLCYRCHLPMMETTLCEYLKKSCFGFEASRCNGTPIKVHITNGLVLDVSRSLFFPRHSFQSSARCNLCSIFSLGVLHSSALFRDSPFSMARIDGIFPICCGVCMCHEFQSSNFKCVHCRYILNGVCKLNEIPFSNPLIAFSLWSWYGESMASFFLLISANAEFQTQSIYGH